LGCLANCAVKRLYELRTAPPASRRVLNSYTEPQLLRFTAVCLGVALGLCPFLIGIDLVIAGVVLVWSFSLVVGYRLPIAKRVMHRLGR
jgi:hypothetical protein